MSYPPPPPQPYSDPPGGYPGYPPPRNGAGTGALVCGVLSIITAVTVFGGVILGLAGIALGVVGRRRAAAGLATNRGAATAGIVTGVLGILVGAAALVGYLTLTSWFLDDIGGRDLVSCLQNAGSNVEAQQACQDEFATSLENRFSLTVTPTP
ncbi:DUF4190 domain-containing protein [Mycolicibacterium fallax]|uniref:Uncharacterized protein n=1 Tax=Mycolicibacterium fallax TaxID=1793 RepID=A0A1X1R7D7_MYCFA|nr:DUF4190 domain-containing protein [Mycolicibacterium fallax]ORV00777.1 hypothetical protein AWC04_15290 [Mycolicibacterium fallax]BBY97261.1 hypothetical protein MFAL_07280 [Mycolicibacterium fallax]HOW95211.1 DUF4190 domain-containing protein [Mycolicibacterium fallax]HSA39191.1 DUF4190 domain-containing protein [Mycobacterium sp.]